MRPSSKLLVSVVLLSVVLLCVQLATRGEVAGAPLRSAAALSPAPTVDDRSTDLTCHGQVCGLGEQCCSCRLSPSSPLTFFCHTPDYCPHGAICMIPPP